MGKSSEKIKFKGKGELVTGAQKASRVKCEGKRGNSSKLGNSVGEKSRRGLKRGEQVS